MLDLLNLGQTIMFAKLFNRRIPIRVKYHITFRCNLACPFCLYRELQAKPGVLEMDTVQIKSMMKEFKGLGTKFWLFSGGEPLLREDLGELILYAKKKMGFHCSITSNGLLLAKKMGEESSFGLLDLVQISLDGPKEIHDRLRQEGSFNGVISAIESLNKKKIKTIILVLVSKNNIECLDFFLKLSSEYGVGLAFQAPGIIPTADEGINQDFFPSLVEFKRFIDLLIEKKKKNHFIISSMPYLKMLKEFWPDIPHKIRCYAGQLSCDISPQGFVAPCCAKINLQDTACDGIKNGFRKAFLNLRDMSKCRDCYYAGPQELNIIWEEFPFGTINSYRDFYRKIR